MSRLSLRWIIALAVCGWAACGVPTDSLAQTRSANRTPKQRPKRDVAPLRKQYQERLSRFQRDLRDLADKLAAEGLPEAAGEVRAAAEPFSPDSVRVRDLPRTVQPTLPADLPAAERDWRVPLRHERRDYAQDLFTLSQKVLAAGHLSFAYDLIREVARHDPDHSAARKALGFVRSGDEWLSPFEAKMQRDRKRWSDQFGWIPEDHQERMAGGERYYKGRWISVEKEAEIRRDFANAWEIRSEHYLIRTNHSLEKGVDLAGKLEAFHSLFLQSMAGFFNTPEQFRQLIAGTGGPRVPTKPLVVHYYRNREEYLTRVRRETNQNIEITRGIYFPRTGVAHFFFDPDSPDDSTLYHEATHQLLSGARPNIGEIGIKSDFWAIEGIACYMESFRADPEAATFGDPQTPRFQYAKAHFVVESYYVPIVEYTRMGMQAYQEAREIKRNYAQGAALVHFFLHYEDGRYRDEFIEYLSQIYSPIKSVREKPESLWGLTEVEPGVLDRQYAEYIRGLGGSDAASDAPRSAGEVTR